MILSDIINKFEKSFPVNLAYDWDNVGLLIGDSNKNINNILCCLDINDDIVEFAINNEIDVIFAHHPLIFHSIKDITTDNFNTRKIMKLIENKIAVYAAHTNLDIANGGLNDYVLENLGLNGEKLILDKLDAIRYMKLDKPKDLKEIMTIISKNLELPYIRYVDTNKKIENLALITGAGADFIPLAIDKKMDLVITSDLKYHESLDAKEQGISLIDIGHFHSEKLSAKLLKRELEKIVDKDVNIYISNMRAVFEIFS